jgi:hypothetical protein
MFLYALQPGPPTRGLIADSIENWEHRPFLNTEYVREQTGSLTVRTVMKVYVRTTIAHLLDPGQNNRLLVVEIDRQAAQDDQATATYPKQH